MQSRRTRGACTCLAIVGLACAGQVGIPEHVGQNEYNESETSFGLLRILGAEGPRLGGDLAQPDLCGFVIWGTDSDYVAVVKQKGPESVGEDLPERALLFYSQRQGGFREQAVYETCDGFVCMYPLYEGVGPLITMWSAGSAMHVVVFGVGEEGLQVLLDTGCRGEPEVVDLDDDGAYELILRQGTPAEEPEAEVYSLGSKCCTFRGTVAWQERFGNRRG